MIHIVTVHYKSLGWIPIQHAHIKANVSQFKMWYFIDEVPFDPWPFDFDVHHKSLSKIRHGHVSKDHAFKLDKMVNELLANEPDDDIVLFLDGDSFPIIPINKIIDEALKENDFFAIVREENDTPFPHPSFACCKLGFWREYNLSWKPWGFDTGNYLLCSFKRNNIKWEKITRSHSLTDHGLLFGVYGGMVYHHGAGFREGYWKDRWDRVVNQPQDREDWRRRVYFREICSESILDRLRSGYTLIQILNQIKWGYEI